MHKYAIQWTAYVASKAAHQQQARLQETPAASSAWRFCHLSCKAQLICM
jgi:hypothetical protein